MSTRLRDFYEVLEVVKTATQDEIKSSYRRLALQWHPDKNAGNEEEATTRFREIQNAYQVLSDPQERSWYDGHKESILRGESHEDVGGDPDPDHIDLWQYFTSSAYSGFDDDDEQGFYKVYAGVFSKLEEEEAQADMMPDSDSDSEDRRSRRAPFKPGPAFGDSRTPIDQILKFYNFWNSFSTRKKFRWCDKYNVRQASERRMRRAMEKENQKERDKARKEFNDLVRQLVSFVKKRDKRVQEYELAKKREEQEKAAKRAEQERAKKEAAELLRKQRMEQFAAEGELSDEHAEEVDAVLEILESHRAARKSASSATSPAQSQPPANGGEDQQQGDAEEEEEEVEPDEFMCSVCNKVFKSQKQWQNHERSKKHIEAVAEVQKFIEEEMALEQKLAAKKKDEDEEEEEVEAVAAEEGEQDEDEEELTPSSTSFGGSKKKDKKQKKKQQHMSVPTDLHSTFSTKKQPEAPQQKASSQAAGKKDKQQKKQPKAAESEEEGGVEENEDDLLFASSFAAKLNVGKKSKSKPKKGQASPPPPPPPAEPSEEEEESEPEAARNDHSDQQSESEGSEAEGESKSQDSGAATKSGKSHAQLKREKRRAKEKEKEKSTGNGKAKPQILACNVCGETFQSRNKLFDHVKETKHALAVNIFAEKQATAPAAQDGSSSQKKKKN